MFGAFWFQLENLPLTSRFCIKYMDILSHNNDLYISFVLSHNWRISLSCRTNLCVNVGCKTYLLWESESFATDIILHCLPTCGTISLVAYAVSLHRHKVTLCAAWLFQQCVFHQSYMATDDLNWPLASQVWPWRVQHQPACNDNDTCARVYNPCCDDINSWKLIT